MDDPHTILRRGTYAFKAEPCSTFVVAWKVRTQGFDTHFSGISGLSQPRPKRLIYPTIRAPFAEAKNVDPTLGSSGLPRGSAEVPSEADLQQLSIY